jgi:hypothetical protein
LELGLTRRGDGVQAPTKYGAAKNQAKRIRSIHVKPQSKYLQVVNRIPCLGFATRLGAEFAGDSVSELSWRRRFRLLVDATKVSEIVTWAILGVLTYCWLGCAYQFPSSSGSLVYFDHFRLYILQYLRDMTYCEGTRRIL